jgi:class 3 adenylate cyclase
LADLALFSFIKVIAKINKFSHILEYRQDEGLIKISKTNPPEYSVKMGFGLHKGWAIEGAIGSFFKIDASYLSPHVNMSSRLEAATK